MTEVEVNGEGQWRPNGANLPWRSIVTDTAPLTMSAIMVKPDPEQAPDSELLPRPHPLKLHAAQQSLAQYSQRHLTSAAAFVIHVQAESSV